MKMRSASLRRNRSGELYSASATRAQSNSPVAQQREKSVRSARTVFALAAIMAALGSCTGEDTPMPPASNTQASTEIVKKDCADPKWKDQNLGLWYSLCRKPLNW
jgi:hypothetical protein